MGVSTNAILCYGIPLVDDQDFPWNEEPYDGELEDWYYKKILGYKNSVEIYDEISGLRKPEYSTEGKSYNDWHPDVHKYYDDYAKFRKNNPMPVTVVYHCSCDYEMQILALPESIVVARRGYPVKIDEHLQSEKVGSFDYLILQNFIDTHGLDVEEEFGWYLASYWC